MATTRAAQQARTRADLIAAASRVFARRGLDRASIDEIAAEAGYTKGAFYASFGSKDELFLAIVDIKFDEAVERLERTLGPGRDDDPEGLTRDAALEFIRAVHADPDWSRLFFEFTVRASRDPEFREHLEARYEVLRGRLASVFSSWSAGFGIEPPVPFDEIATMVYCMANGFLAEQLIEPGLGEDVYATMQEIFFRGLRSLAEDRATARAGEPGAIGPEA